MEVNMTKKVGISLDDETLKLCDKYASLTSRSRSEFIATAIREYVSQIEVGRQKNVIAESLADEIVKGSEAGVTKISKGLFRYAVELEMVIMILSELTDIPTNVMEEYRREAVRNVRRTRGKVNLDDLIARNNREFAEKRIAENPYRYGEDEEIVNIYEVDDDEL
jgi:predicted transcriptional regulator